MSKPESPGDSTPSLDFLREHDDGSRTQWPTDPDHDSATDMLPPEDQAANSPTDTEGNVDGDEYDDGGSSIHKAVVLDNIESPDADAHPPPAETSSSDSPADSDAAFDAVSASHATDKTESAVHAEPLIDEAPVSDDSSRAQGQGNLLVVVLASYASAVTIALLYILFQRASPSQLESLPDVPPLKDGEVQLVPVDAVMPPGHTLALGESRRFGNIVIEPMSVVREPLTYAHFSGRDDLTKPETEPVVKLWLRFTNESREQSIAPLDGEMLFTRVYRPETGETRANQFVCSLDTKSAAGQPVFVYDYSPSDEFDLVDQQLGRVLEPGESYETYIPTTEEAQGSLTGELVWRVHFRKGYSPQGPGVTTVIEVRFDQRSIESDSATT